MTIPYIPYFQTSRYRVTTMIELAEIHPGEHAADLGSGDGRIVIALTNAGAITTGYELDETLITLSRENIEKTFSQPSEESLLVNKDSSPSAQNDKYGILPQILKKDFWYEDLSKYSVICCYPMPDIMGRLEKKLQDELLPGSRVLLNYFPFLHWKEAKRKDNIFLYRKK